MNDTVTVVAIIAVASAWLLWRVWRFVRGRRSDAACGCTKCPAKERAASPHKRS